MSGRQAMSETDGASPPAVSVVIPLYDKAPYVPAAVRSVQAQTFRNFEIIVVDDGSTDGGAELVEGIDDSRLRLLRQANAGPGAARNAGIRAARGRWIAFLDADDTWLPERLARQLAVLGREPALVWAAGAFVRTVNDEVVQATVKVEDAWLEAPEVVRDALLVLARGWDIFIGSVLVRRDVLLAEGGFDARLETGEDIDLWLRLAVRHPRVAFVRTPIAVYAMAVAGSISGQNVASGRATNTELARRCMTLAGGLPDHRRRLLAGIARRLIRRQIRRQLAAGQLRAARAALLAARDLDLKLSRWYVLATYLPPGLAPLARQGWALIRNMTSRA